MTWLHRYQLKHAVRSALWLGPVSAIAAVVVFAPLVRWVDRATGWGWLDFTPDGARVVLGAFTASMLTLVVFVVSSLLIVVQLASAQLTPRIIARVLSEPRLKWVLSAFTFSYAYTIAVSGRIDAATPQLPVAVAIACNLLSLAVFFWFVQWLGGSLRPIAIFQRVAEVGRDVVEAVYPDPFGAGEEHVNWSPVPAGEALVVEHTGRSGVVLAFALADLVAVAERADVVIELVPQVGDYVARGDPLFRVRRGGHMIEAAELRGCVAIGPERTTEQDPRFAFRVLVDIANKALSPAINDPTTAVLALDQVHHLLMHVGTRRLDAGQTRDARGNLRLCYGTPDWDDFVSLGATEIRHFGAGSMQIARRLRAMLDHLIQVLPAARRPALLRELALLQRAVERQFPDEEDRVHARVGDFQGVGSSEPSAPPSHPAVEKEFG